MNESKEFRELIRILERKSGLLNQEGGGCCYNISLAQCDALVEIGQSDSISIKSFYYVGINKFVDNLEVSLKYVRNIF